ncbi:hypothetical protein LINGRAHAP2_LOCUS31906, partial [Linum grandiflorum]
DNWEGKQDGGQGITGREDKGRGLTDQKMVAVQLVEFLKIALSPVGKEDGGQGITGGKRLLSLVAGGGQASNSGRSQPLGARRTCNRSILLSCRFGRSEMKEER